MLEGLSVDQTIEVLRNAPGGLEEQLAQLPPSLHSLAAVALVASLGKSFTLPEHSGQPYGLPLVSLCVDTTQARADLDLLDKVPPNAIDAPFRIADEAANACIWPVSVEATPANIGTGLFSVEQRAASTACCLFAKSLTIAKQTINLPEASQLLFGSYSGDMTLQNVTLQGMQPLTPTLLPARHAPPAEQVPVLTKVFAYVTLQNCWLAADFSQLRYYSSLLVRTSLFAVLYGLPPLSVGEPRVLVKQQGCSTSDV